MNLNMADCGPRLTKDMLAAFAESMKVILPPQMVSFLLKTNGGVPDRRLYDIPGHWDCGDSVDFFVGINHQNQHMRMEQYIVDLDVYVRGGALPIACTPTGSLVCIIISELGYGAIVHVDIADPLDEAGQKRRWSVAPSFDEFCNGLRGDP